MKSRFLALAFGGAGHEGLYCVPRAGGAVVQLDGPLHSSSSYYAIALFDHSVYFVRDDVYEPTWTAPHSLYKIHQ
jgi:hypothetical protein